MTGQAQIERPFSMLCALSMIFEPTAAHLGEDRMLLSAGAFQVLISKGPFSKTLCGFCPPAPLSLQTDHGFRRLIW
jgi:hypothetical protein